MQSKQKTSHVTLELFISTFFYFWSQTCAKSKFELGKNRVKINKMWTFFCVILTICSFVISTLVSGQGTTYHKCLHSGWIPYKNEKCLKILNLYETHSAAISSCQKQLLFDDLIEVNLHATLLQISSKDEEEFVDKLLFNISRYADNVWLGAVRDGPRAQFRWLDGTSLNNFSVYQKWAYGNPTGDFMKNCVELRSRDNHNFNYNLGSSGGNRPASAGASGGGGDPAPPNPSSWWSSPSAPGGGSGGGFPSSPGADPGPNPNAFFSRDQGNWYNVPCTKHNLVVCQISQLVPEQVVQLQVVKTKKEITKLRMELDDLRRLVGELAANVVTDVRLGSKETTDIWHGPGFPDGGGYVVTGIMNWDENSCADSVSRRKFQKFVNGKWYDVY
ncbi:uncharacterized protein LOC110856020 [Folsomia candida]|uniref:Tail fiber protein S n=1 Tax=Folsomia candida TaxID=158441 RepID=A0A226DPE0_FOLCA|nr:uncharacterized protein LOC110856020 [Folsomia candida]OXA46704.1 Tail fiber protein S' [Folsomia candida]